MFSSFFTFGRIKKNSKKAALLLIGQPFVLLAEKNHQLFKLKVTPRDRTTVVDIPIAVYLGWETGSK